MPASKRSEKRKTTASTKPASKNPPHDSVPRRIMLIHGFGEPVDLENWSKPWEAKLRRTFRKAFPTIDGIKFQTFSYHTTFEDDFTADELKPKDLTAALASLGWAGKHKGINGMLRGTDGLDAATEALYWNAGMVVRWVKNSALRRKLRNALKKKIEAENPSVICRPFPRFPHCL